MTMMSTVVLGLLVLAVLVVVAGLVVLIVGLRRRAGRNAGSDQ